MTCVRAISQEGRRRNSWLAFLDSCFHQVLSPSIIVPALLLSRNVVPSLPSVSWPSLTYTLSGTVLICPHSLSWATFTCILFAFNDECILLSYILSFFLPLTFPFTFRFLNSLMWIPFISFLMLLVHLLLASHAFSLLPHLRRGTHNSSLSWTAWHIARPLDAGTHVSATSSKTQSASLSYELLTSLPGARITYK